MKLVSIINAWQDTLCLLPHVMLNHLQFCDSVVLVWSSMSNHWNSDDGKMLAFICEGTEKVLNVQCEPVKGLTPLANETRKRNAGIEYARSKGFTHFFLADGDEFYTPNEVHVAKGLFDEPNLNGLVCPLRVYVGKPTLSCKDHTLVSFIHKLKDKTYAGNFKEYPYAYDEQGNAHIDPSRRINETRGIVMCDVTMHHLSYIRSDIQLKIDNSSANLRRSEAAIKRDIVNACPGYVSELYHRPLEETPNYFNIHV